MIFIMVQYRDWREASGEMLADGFKGTTDCGELSAREDFSVFAGLPETISFEEMFALEKEYNAELVESVDSSREPLSENTQTWDAGQRKLSEEKRIAYEAARSKYTL